MPILPVKVDEGPSRNLTIRVPAKILERVKDISKSSGWNQTEVILHILRWGLEELEKEAAAQDGTAKRK